jgi:Holliday junction resolvase RusA-like endonuclease
VSSSHIVLNLPVPPSVNRARKVNWGKNGHAKVTAWHQKADAYVMVQKTLRCRAGRPVDRFELHITFSEQHTRVDLDNPIKALIDYLRRIEAIVDDGPQHLRKLTVEWGEASEGCRVMIIPLTD